MSQSVSASENVYCFGDIKVDAENFRVQKNGRAVTLTPRAFDVLIFLLKNTGRVVEKQEIFENIWKENFVSDNSLTKIIKEIRHAIDDDAARPRYIETVPKRGYRFIGELAPPQHFGQKVFVIEKIFADGGGQNIVEENKPGETPVEIKNRDFPLPRLVFSKPLLALFLIGLISILALAAAWLPFRQQPLENLPPRSIAVLPFKPLNIDGRDESLEMGMAETLITRLSNLKQVTVRPMSAVRRYTDLQQDPIKAGREIQAETVLDGSIQKAGERVRVTVRLISVRDGKTLWTEHFDENFTDIFKVQDSIAERVTGALTLELSKQEKEQLAKHFTDNADAYQLYLRGQLFWHGRRRNWIKQSLEFYQQALEKDPNFALAHIGIADAYMMLSGHRRISMSEAETKARAGIMKALEIDNTLALAHNALGELKYQYEYDWAGAEKEFKLAVELNPNIAWIRQAHGWFLMSTGRFEEAVAAMEKARELDPSSLTVNVGRGRLFYFSRQYDEAIQHFQNIIAVEPNDSSAYYALHTIYEQKQMYAESVEAFLKSMSLNNAPPERIEEFREAFKTGGWRGFLRKQLENMEKKAGTERIHPYGFANLYVRLGQKEEAFFWLEKTFEQRDPAIIQFKVDPMYDLVRDDPRYTELLAKINLQP